ncbi:MAG: M28 family peptidase [Deltaproteobacteria bacterium]|nr:M28 family peptidase [Deltaproteobacteria bacterium]
MSGGKMFGVTMGVLLGLLSIASACAWATMIRMPGEGRPEALPEPEPAAVERLVGAVRHLAGTLGERNLGDHPEALAGARDWIRAELEAAGLEVTLEHVPPFDEDVGNLIVELPGERSEVVLVGAHYDSVLGTPGADDNASGVAALLELARRFARRHAEDRPARTLRLVAWVNEEPPYFKEPTMGSLVNARNAAGRGDPLLAALSLESIGYFDPGKGSQRYPFPLSLFYPSRGDFLAFVGDRDSEALVRRCVKVFRERGTLPSEGAALPGEMPGVSWSDHWSYWQTGVPAVMVTGTAPFRDPHYHEPTDTPDRIDGRRLALAVDGLEAVLEDLLEN